MTLLTSKVLIFTRVGMFEADDKVLHCIAETTMAIVYLPPGERLEKLQQTQEHCQQQQQQQALA